MRGKLPRVLEVMMARYGWICTGVPGKAMYTVGLLDKFGHPELMMHGMFEQQMHGLLVPAVENHVRKGYEFTPGFHHNIAEGYPAKIVDVHPSNFPDWLGIAKRYHESWSQDPLRVRQILWCDVDRNFPGEPGYDNERFPQLRFDVRRPEYDE